MFTQTDNDSEILDFLHDIEFKIDDFNTDRITSFYVGTSYYLLLFFSKQDDKGFQLFRVDNFKDNLSDLLSLQNHLCKAFDATKFNMLKKAISQVEIQVAAVRAVKIVEGSGGFRS